MQLSLEFMGTTGTLRAVIPEESSLSLGRWRFRLLSVVLQKLKEGNTNPVIKIRSSLAEGYYTPDPQAFSRSRSSTLSTFPIEVNKHTFVTSTAWFNVTNPTKRVELEIVDADTDNLVADGEFQVHGLIQLDRVFLSNYSI
jgi:hypothetical protein